MLTYHLLFTLADGHRIFSKDGQPGWLIADDSGETPIATDDGELYLDLDRNLLIDQTEDDDGRLETSCFIPLRTAKGNRSQTISNPATLMHLAVTFSWQITVSVGTADSIEIKSFDTIVKSA